MGFFQICRRRLESQKPPVFLIKNPILSSALVLLTAAASPAAPVHLVDEAPVEIRSVAPGVFLVDFGCVAFGNLRVTPPPGANQEITVHFGEAFAGGRINRNPPGSVRYSSTKLVPEGGKPMQSVHRRAEVKYFLM